MTKIANLTSNKTVYSRKTQRISDKIKSRKAAGLDEIPPEVWKSRKFAYRLFRFCNIVYKQKTIEKWTKECILPFPEKGDRRITKNYRSLTSIAVNIYNALLFNHIEPEIEKILGKNQNGFPKNLSLSQILVIRWTLGVHANNLEAAEYCL